MEKSTYIKLAALQIEEPNLSKLLVNNGGVHMTSCPECHQTEFSHDVDCEIHQEMNIDLDTSKSKRKKSIKTARLKAGLSRKVLAKKIGVRPETLARWEREEYSPDPRNMRRLVRALQTKHEL